VFPVHSGVSLSGHPIAMGEGAGLLPCTLPCGFAIKLKHFMHLESAPMSLPWTRRVTAWLGISALALLGACSSGTIESQFKPTRMVAFGDGFSDLGQSGSKQTVNDGAAANIWVEELAAQYGLTIKPSATGGNSYAYVNARILNTPDVVQNASTPTIKQQIDRFLAKDSFGATDLVVLNGGVSDTIYQMNLTLAGGQSAAQMTANLQQAGRDLGSQVRRLVEAGAQYVLVAGSYNLSRTPWATRIAQTTPLNDAMVSFNEAFLVSIVDLGAHVLYVDLGYYYNLVTGLPTSYALTDATTVVCTSTDSSDAIGVGAGQVNSALCTTSTISSSLTSGTTYNSYFFADSIYPTPVAQRLFGDYAFGRIRARW